MAGAADVEQVYSVPLRTIAFSSGSSTYYKYGIHLGIGGGAPALFEFDTGGEGFYAAYSSSAAWWGPNVSVTATSFTKSFSSGLTYEGFVAEAPLTFYKADGQTVFAPATTARIGQSTPITNGATTLWPNSGGSAPVDGNFFGDFGLTLKRGAHGIENFLAQLTYGNGITGGYKVSLGPYGSIGQAVLQIGLNAADLANPDTIWFQMQGANPSDPFPGADSFSSYSAELLLADLTLQLGSEVETFPNLGINLDTGNPTPGLDFNAADGSRLRPFSSADLLALSNGVLLTLQSDPTVGPGISVFQLLAGDDYGRNFVYESERSDGGSTYLNVGALIFQQYQVTYNIEDGLLGLTPIPEPSVVTLLAAAALAIGLRRPTRSSQRRNIAHRSLAGWQPVNVGRPKLTRDRNGRDS